jgi:TRAP-type uncharacterized transport system substrate-binding protein
MEPLPTGANFKRGKILWELGLDIAGNPETPYGGNRDMCIVVGSGAGASFKPWLRLATGSAVMAHAVANGEIDAVFVNPSAMLTQAYRGVGLFDKPLPLRILASYPSIDRFVVAMRTSLGFKSLHDVRKAKHPLHISLREDPTHSTLVLIDQLLAHHDMSLDMVRSWGGSVHPIGGPGDKRRMAAIRDGAIDTIMDEGISTWIDEALANGFAPVDLDEAAFAHLTAIGWRRVPLSHGRFAHLPAGHDCIDFSGWPLYASAAMPDKTAYDICSAFGARHDWMPWEKGTHEGLGQLGRETDATPMDVPLHPGAERWYRERGLLG